MGNPVVLLSTCIYEDKALHEIKSWEFEKFDGIVYKNVISDEYRVYVLKTDTDDFFEVLVAIDMHNFKDGQDVSYLVNAVSKITHSALESVFQTECNNGISQIKYLKNIIFGVTDLDKMEQYTNFIKQLSEVEF